ncbi:MAG: hypothetical protein SFY66_14830 [Oculatellaceae cyanobacterium bins.114]|nr:hypothetical protein [Oculatellaceae cyanobacterium bins.114]
MKTERRKMAEKKIPKKSAKPELKNESEKRETGKKQLIDTFREIKNGVKNEKQTGLGDQLTRERVSP